MKQMRHDHKMPQIGWREPPPLVGSCLPGCHEEVTSAVMASACTVKRNPIGKLGALDGFDAGESPASTVPGFDAGTPLTPSASITAGKSASVVVSASSFALDAGAVHPAPSDAGARAFDAGLSSPSAEAPSQTQSSSALASAALPSATATATASASVSASASVPVPSGQGCADGTVEALGTLKDLTGVAACAGTWTGSVAGASNLCAHGWHVCRGTEVALSGLTYDTASAFLGCYAFDAVQNNNQCLPGCASQAGVIDTYANLDMAGLGGDCPFKFSGAGSCITGGRIDASENSGTGCDYSSGLTGVVCCQDDQGCAVGSVTSAATAQDVQLFGAIVYYNDGAVLPAGRYRASYVDGCMKYSSTQDWAIHAYQDGSIAWYVGTAYEEKLVRLPGTYGIFAGQGGFATFQECVDANLLLGAVEFDFAGGPLGVWLADSSYSDNLAGEGARNPRWRLERVSEVCETPLEGR